MAADDRVLADAERIVEDELDVFRLEHALGALAQLRVDLMKLSLLWKAGHARNPDSPLVLIITQEILRSARTGGGFQAADGGVLKSFAHGGLEDHVAQVVPPGTWRVWGEPETGGEAYIPLAPSKRDRSEAILSEVARLFDMGLVPAGGSSSTTTAAGAWSYGIGGDSLDELRAAQERGNDLLARMLWAIERIAPDFAGALSGATATAYQLARGR